MSKDNKIEVLKTHQDISDRSYTPQELVHELQSIINTGKSDNFIVLHFGEKTRGLRFATTKKRDEFEDIAMMGLMLNITLKDLINF